MYRTIPNSVPGKINSVIVWEEAIEHKLILELESRSLEYYYKRDNGLPVENTKIPKESFLAYDPIVVEKSIKEISHHNSIGNITSSQGEQVLFSALMNNLHGPYGFSSFKQLRASQNWLMRHFSKNNIFSFVSENGKTITFKKTEKFYRLINQNMVIFKISLKLLCLKFTNL